MFLSHKSVGIRQYFNPGLAGCFGGGRGVWCIGRLRCFHRTALVLSCFSWSGSKADSECSQRTCMWFHGNHERTWSRCDLFNIPCQGRSLLFATTIRGSTYSTSRQWWWNKFGHMRSSFGYRRSRFHGLPISVPHLFGNLCRNRPTCVQSNQTKNKHSVLTEDLFREKRRAFFVHLR